MNDRNLSYVTTILVLYYKEMLGASNKNAGKKKMDSLDGEFLISSKRGTASLSKETYSKPRRTVPKSVFQ